MIALTLSEIAGIVAGVGHGVDGDDVVITAPAAVDSREIESGGLFVALAGEHGVRPRWLLGRRSWWQ